MTEIIRKTLTAKVAQVSEASRTIEFVASTEGLDRGDEIIQAEAWQLERYRQNPVVLFAHDYHSLPVGRAPEVVVLDSQLIAPIEFADEATYPFADTCYRLAKAGFLNAVSVGFIPLEWEDGETGRTFTKAELLEISLVPVPANPEALVSAREAGVISVKELRSLQQALTRTKAPLPYEKTPLADEGEAWDAGAEVKAASVDDLKAMCALVEGDPENKTSYKLPHHKAAGRHACVWAGVRAAAAVLQGGRGGVTASGSDLAAAKAHIGKHYTDFGKGEPPWAKAYSQEQLRDEIDFARWMVMRAGIADETKEVAMELAKDIWRKTGGDTPEGISKAGRSISRKNEAVIKDAMRVVKETLEAHEVYHKGHNEYHKAHKAALEAAHRSLEELVKGRKDEAEEEAEEEEAGCECEGCKDPDCECTGAACKDDSCECACHESRKRATRIAQSVLARMGQEKE